MDVVVKVKGNGYMVGVLSLCVCSFCKGGGRRYALFMVVVRCHVGLAVAGRDAWCGNFLFHAKSQSLLSLSVSLRLIYLSLSLVLSVSLFFSLISSSLLSLQNKSCLCFSHFSSKHPLLIPHTHLFYFLSFQTGVVLIRVGLSDRVARLNGETVRLLLLDDLPGFKVRCSRLSPG